MFNLFSFIESNFGVNKIIYFHGKDTSVDISNLVSMTINPESECGSANKAYSNELLVKYCVDTDTDIDGVADLSDLDDDNDGITDIQEMVSCPSPPTCTSVVGFYGAQTTPACIGWSRVQNNVDFDFIN